MPNSLAIDDSLDVDTNSQQISAEASSEPIFDKALHMTIAQEAFDRNETYSGEESHKILVERLGLD